MKNIFLALFFLLFPLLAESASQINCKPVLKLEDLDPAVNHPIDPRDKDQSILCGILDEDLSYKSSVAGQSYLFDFSYRQLEEATQFENANQLFKPSFLIKGVDGKQIIDFSKKSILMLYKKYGNIDAKYHLSVCYLNLRQRWDAVFDFVSTCKWNQFPVDEKKGLKLLHEIAMNESLIQGVDGYGYRGDAIRLLSIRAIIRRDFISAYRYSVLQKENDKGITSYTFHTLITMASIFFNKGMCNGHACQFSNDDPWAP